MAIINPNAPVFESPFRCASPRCEKRGNHFPIICCPFTGHLAHAHKPFTVQLRIPMCEKHAKEYPLDAFMTEATLENLKRTADEKGLKVDFHRAYISPVEMKMADYQHLMRRKDVKRKAMH